MNDQKIRTKRLFLVAAIVLLIGLAYYIWIKITGIAVPCVTNLLTGIYCPGCGITRMLLALCSGNFALAARNNLLAFVLLVPITLFGVNRGVKYIKQGHTDFSKHEKACIVIFIALILIFTVARNIPCLSFLRPI